MAGTKEFNSDLNLLGKAIVNTVPNATGTVLTYDLSTKAISTRTHAQIISDMSLMTTNTDQFVLATKYFLTTDVNTNENSNKLWIRTDDGVANPGITFYKTGIISSVLSLQNDGFHFGVGNIYEPITTAGYKKYGYNNNFILLAGGGHIPVSEFATINHTHSNLYSPATGSTNANVLFSGNALNLKFYSAVYSAGSGSTNLFPHDNDANAILHISTWTDEHYGHQLGFSSNGSIYQRYKDFSGFTDWRKLLNSVDALDYVTLSTPQTITGEKIFAVQPVKSNEGFQNTVYHAGRNRIWSFGNSDQYGLSYQQGEFVVGGTQYGEGINFHFGDSSDFKVHIRSSGDIYTRGYIWTDLTGNSSQWYQAYNWGNHANAGYLTYTNLIGYATESWVSGNYTSYSFLAQNYALRTGSNATDAWVNASLGLITNPTIQGRTMNASGTVNLNEATYGHIAGYINNSGIAAGNPLDQWFHRIKMLHGNSAGYFGEIGVQMTGGNSMWYKRFENGNYYDWVQVWDKENLPDFRLYGLGTINPVNALDLNNVSHTSILDVNDSTINKPFGYGSVWTHRKGGNEYTQIAVGVVTGDLYTRAYFNAGGSTGWLRNWNSSHFNSTDIGNWNNKVNRNGDTMTGGLIIRTPDSVGSNNLGTLPSNLKLFLSNGALYGTVFWTQGTGGGYIQQQRADGQQTAYPLNLQPYGGGLFYGSNEVATVNQIPSLSGYATQTWVSQNYIPITHPSYGISVGDINNWYEIFNYGIRINQEFTGTRLMLSNTYYGSESGLIDTEQASYVAGKVEGSPYYKYGSLYNEWQGINFNYEAELFGIGKELTNDEDKVQVEGNISVDTKTYLGNQADLILNPLYNSNGDIRDSRHAHIYITTGSPIRLPIQPILGQRIEIYNRSDSDLEVIHDNIGVLFIIPAWRIARGFVSSMGFVFDEEPVRGKEYEV